MKAFVPGQGTLHSGALCSLHRAEGSTIRPAGSDHKDSPWCSSLHAKPHPAAWGTYPRGRGVQKQLDTDSASSCSSPEASAHADSLSKQPLWSSEPRYQTSSVQLQIYTHHRNDVTGIQFCNSTRGELWAKHVNRKQGKRKKKKRCSI